MPIDRSKYPADWPIISDMIRMRADDRCEGCGAANYDPILRLADGSRVEHDGRRYSAEGKPLPTASKTELAEGKHVTVRCACAHLDDPDPMNCDPRNLAWFCQQCHNRYDMAMRAKNISATKRKKRKTK